MAEIKINELKFEKSKETDQIIDLKTAKKDSPEFTAFQTIHGGRFMATTKWSSCFMMMSVS